MNTDKSPMFKPFVVDIDKIEKTGEHSLRFHLKRVNAAAFAVTALGRVFIVPKHVWEPHLKSLEGKPENLERSATRRTSAPVRSARCARASTRRSCSTASPTIGRAEDRPGGAPRHPERRGRDRHAALRRHQPPVGIWRRPRRAREALQDNPAIKLTTETDVAWSSWPSTTGAAFNDVAFRNALSPPRSTAMCSCRRLERLRRALRQATSRRRSASGIRLT